MATQLITYGKERALLKPWLAFAQIAGASIILALSAQISLPLFFTPIPFSMQTMAVLFIGAMLGPKKGVASILLYLIEGCCGLPFFAQGSAGLLTLIGPKGGYLLGFLAQAYITGWFFEKNKDMPALKISAVLLLACFVQLILGTVWLGQYVGYRYVLEMGFYPFAVVEMMKVFGITFILTRMKLNRLI
jgi:biotin transport system substrate-specific component